MTYARTRRRHRLTVVLVMSLVASGVLPVASVEADSSVLVQAGDSLSSIAFNHGVTVDALMVANGLTDPDLVYMGQELVIPDDSGVPTTTARPSWSPSSTARASRSSPPDTA